MQDHRRNLRDLYKLSRSESRGLAYFLGLCIAISYISETKDYFVNSNQKLDAYRSAAASLQLAESPSAHFHSAEQVLPELMPFDPNLASEEVLISIGLPIYLAKRIIKYRGAGGSFKAKDDLKKIYGLNDSLFNILQPFILVKKAATFESTQVKNTIDKKERKKIEINRADSATFISLRGIGPVYAGRIVRYRESLGGFVHKSQLREVYGINDSLYLELSDKISCDSNALKQVVNINTASMGELYSHPYLRNRTLCRSIVRYRERHGPFNFQADLTNLHLMKDSILSKISPYLNFQTD